MEIGVPHELLNWSDDWVDPTRLCDRDLEAETKEFSDADALEDFQKSEYWTWHRFPLAAELPESLDKISQHATVDVGDEVLLLGGIHEPRQRHGRSHEPPIRLFRMDKQLRSLEEIVVSSGKIGPCCRWAFRACYIPCIRAVFVFGGFDSTSNFNDCHLLFIRDTPAEITGDETSVIKSTAVSSSSGKAPKKKATHSHRTYTWVEVTAGRSTRRYDEEGQPFWPEVRAHYTLATHWHLNPQTAASKEEFAVESDEKCEADAVELADDSGAVFASASASADCCDAKSSKKKKKKLDPALLAVVQRHKQRAATGRSQFNIESLRPFLKELSAKKRGEVSKRGPMDWTDPFQRDSRQKIAQRKRFDIFIFGGQYCGGGPYVQHDTLYRFSFLRQKDALGDETNGHIELRRIRTRGCQPTARSHAFGAVIGSVFLLFGGTTPKKSLNSMFALDLESRCWHRVDYGKKRPATATRTVESESARCLPPEFTFVPRDYRITALPGLCWFDRRSLMLYSFVAAGASLLQVYAYSVRHNGWAHLSAERSVHSEKCGAVRHLTPPKVYFPQFARIGNALLFVGGKGGGRSRDAPENRLSLVLALKMPDSFPWRIERLVWLSALKNDGAFRKLPFDLIKLVISYI